MANFEEINRARNLLDLGDAATYEEIKKAYRQKTFQHHPDTGCDDMHSANLMKQLNWAYKLLIEYVDNYSYSFNQEDVARTYPYYEYI